jgi:arylsulfatase A-like enzyme
MPTLTRRDTLKLASAFVGGSLLSSAWLRSLAAPAASERPNILILVFDTLSAPHLSVYGYPRQTTPNMERFASHATVYHSHYAEGSYTTPGAASILTGLLPWTHRAINPGAPVRRDLAPNNLFSAVGDDYFRIGFSQNLWAEIFLRQFNADLDLHLPPTSFAFPNPLLLGASNPRDMIPYYAYEGHLVGGIKLDSPYPGSVTLGALDIATGRGRNLDPELKATGGKGIPYNGSFYYINRTVFQGIFDTIQTASKQNRPYMGYFHLWSPHEPYAPQKEFTGLFDDNLKAPRKPKHPMTGDALRDLELYQYRRVYDQYVADVDAEFGRFLDALDAAGLRENTYIVIMSDHGQLFERGVHGHESRLLYDGVLHVPLLVSAPGQTERLDVHVPTGNADLLPTLAALAGRDLPFVTEGAPLPGLGGEADSSRPIYSMLNNTASAFLPLRTGTFTLLKEGKKLILYTGYAGFDDIVELYDLQADPDEMRDLSSSDPRTTKRLLDELQAARAAADEPFTRK